MQFLFGETRVLSERRAWLVNAYANRAARDAHVPLSAFGNMYAGGEIPQVPEKMRVLIDGKYYGNCMIDRLDMSKIGMPETTAIEWLREFSGASVSIVHGPYGRSTVNASSNARTDVPLSSVNIVTSSTKVRGLNLGFFC